MINIFIRVIHIMVGIAGVFAKNEIWWPSGTTTKNTHTGTSTTNEHDCNGKSSRKKKMIKKIANLV